MQHLDDTRYWNQIAWAHLVLTSCVPLGKVVNLSVSQLLVCNVELAIEPDLSIILTNECLYMNHLEH